MTNEEAITYLMNNSCYECSYGCESAYKCHVTSCAFKNAIKESIAALEKQKYYGWHDLEKNPEDLPKKDGQYIIFTEDGRFARWYWREGMDWTGVVMWQQLPEEIERRLT